MDSLVWSLTALGTFIVLIAMLKGKLGKQTQRFAWCTVIAVFVTATLYLTARIELPDGRWGFWLVAGPLSIALLLPLELTAGLRARSKALRESRDKLKAAR